MQENEAQRGADQMPCSRAFEYVEVERECLACMSAPRYFRFGECVNSQLCRGCMMHTSIRRPGGGGARVGSSTANAKRKFCVFWDRNGASSKQVSKRSNRSFSPLLSLPSLPPSLPPSLTHPPTPPPPHLSHNIYK